MLLTAGSAMRITILYLTAAFILLLLTENITCEEGESSIFLIL